MTRRVKTHLPGTMSSSAVFDALITFYETGNLVGTNPLITGTKTAFPVITKVSAGLYDFTFAGGTVLRVTAQDQVEVMAGVPLRTIAITADASNEAAIEMSCNPTSLVIRIHSNNTAMINREHYAFEEPVDPTQDGVKVSRLFQLMYFTNSEIAVTSKGYENGNVINLNGHFTRCRPEPLWQNTAGTYDLVTQSARKRLFPLSIIRTDCTVHTGSNAIMVWPGALTFDDSIVVDGVKYVVAASTPYAPRISILMPEIN